MAAMLSQMRFKNRPSPSTRPFDELDLVLDARLSHRSAILDGGHIAIGFRSLDGGRIEVGEARGLRDLRLAHQRARRPDTRFDDRRALLPSPLRTRWVVVVRIHDGLELRDARFGLRGGTDRLEQVPAQTTDWHLAKIQSTRVDVQP